MISLQRSMHSSQMYTPGPAMSFLTCFWLFPQKEHLSRSPPSPMRATGSISSSPGGPGRDERPGLTRPTVPRRVHGRTPESRGSHAVALTAERPPEAPLERLRDRPGRSGVHRCRGVGSGAEDLVDHAVVL